MKVMKFGGTSVGSVNSILSVKRIVESASAGEPVIVVVSALGGITDKLINTSKMAATGDSAYEGEFREIVYRHVEMIKEVVPAGEGQVALQRQIGELLNELKDIFQGIYLIKDLSPKTSDMEPNMWRKLVCIIHENYDRYQGFVILHGTDTMAYTASALSFMLEGLDKPVILTGSQLPIGVLRTDGKENLMTSIEIAIAQNKEGKALVPEVCIFFENHLMRGNRTTKINVLA